MQSTESREYRVESTECARAQRREEGAQCPMRAQCESAEAECTVREYRVESAESRVQCESIAHDQSPAYSAAAGAAGSRFTCRHEAHKQSGASTLLPQCTPCTIPVHDCLTALIPEYTAPCPLPCAARAHHCSGAQLLAHSDELLE